ncbi:MAG: hypothetical protein HRU38_13275 [Saccharospirillaceae bacterium]|nr:hypothetical protein [Pseudomonadales bacterium]NRB79615.1 hypothetical protein [Saccharospirillaceae bacterium]
MKNYSVLLHEKSFEKVSTYLQSLLSGEYEAGTYLSKSLIDEDLTALSDVQLLEKIIQTKKPQIFAESEVMGDGSDWNQIELSILGDVVISMPVTVFNDAKHNNPLNHAKPFLGSMLFVSGALLRNDSGEIAVDYHEIVKNDRIDDACLFDLYERRLLPALKYANDDASKKNKQALVTIPGLGCGQFAGKFKGLLEGKLKQVILKLLSKYNSELTNIKAVYFDPYNQCDNERIEINHISFLVRPLQQGNHNKPQLCKPEQYEDKQGEFSNSDLYSVVAWDHVSWPGNDFFVGDRVTDDGVKSASTNSMFKITGVEGSYNTNNFCYEPAQRYNNWNDVISQNNIKFDCLNLQVIS